jgi:hypothetical protein
VEKMLLKRERKVQPPASWAPKKRCDEKKRIYITSAGVQRRIIGCCLPDVVRPTMVTDFTASNQRLMQFHEVHYTMEMSREGRHVVRTFSGFKMEVLPESQDSRE